jgi:anti-anti-sigma regulatory factor
MASSFRIVMHEASENLHLRLIGDFDGSSAFELIELLKNRAHAVQKVFIHTSGLGEVHPFGLGVFEKRASELREELQKIHFTGDKAELVSPDQSLCLMTRHHSTAEKNGK